MKKQLVELTEEEIEKAKPVGRPKVFTAYTENAQAAPIRVRCYQEIHNLTPANANAFLLGRANRTILYGFLIVPIQYYKIGGEKK